MRKNIFIGIVLCFFGISVLAQEDSLLNRKVVRLGPVVVTGDGYHQYLRSSVTPVRVITLADIQRTGFGSFTDVITSMMPQLSVSPNSTGSYLHLNGLGNKYVLVLVNGKKLIGDISGNIDLNRMDLSGICRIEVLDGAASSLYGSDAIGGVINIITDQPTDHPFSFIADTRVSGKGQFGQSVHLNLYRKGFGSYTSFCHDQAGYFRNNDYEYVSGNAGAVQRSLAPLTSGFRTNLFTQRFIYQTQQHLSFFAEGNYNWHKTYRPQTSDETTGGFDYELRSEDWRWDTGVTYKFTKEANLQFRLTGDNYSYGNEYKVATPTQSAGDYVRKKTQKMYEAELKGTFSFYRNSVTIAGIDWRNDFLNSVAGDVDNHVYTWAAYLQHESQLARDLEFIFGARYNDHELFGVNFTPKIALRYAPGRFVLRAAYSRGYRAPGLDELYYRYISFVRNFSTITIGNKTLKPESSNYFSLSAEYNAQYWSLGITGFANDVNDMIVEKIVKLDAESLSRLRVEFPEITDAQAIKTDHYNLYVNSDKGQIYGLQLDATLNPVDGLDISAKYACIYGRQQTDGVWQNLERSIRNTLTLMTNYHHAWHKYVLDINFNGRLQSKTYYPPEYENAPGFGIWNLNVIQTLQWGRGCSIQPSIGIENIFNTKDDRIDSSTLRYANFSAGRMMVVGLKIKFW